MLNVKNVLDLYLQEDGLTRDIVKDLANPMGFSVYSKAFYPKNANEDFYACIWISKNKKGIYINSLKLLSAEEMKFILAYQLAEVIYNNVEEDYFSSFSLLSIDMEVYELAKKIYDRGSKKVVKKRKKG